MKYWSKASNKKMYTKQKKDPLLMNEQDVNFLHKFNSREKTLREIEQEKQIAALKNTIEELKIEMQDLKEEIEMLNAMNQEC